MINILEMLEYNANINESKILFEDNKEKFSYRKVIDMARHIGSFIAQNGETKRAVAILMQKSAVELVAFLGVVYAGDFYIPLDNEMPFERMEKILDTIDPVHIIVDDKMKEVNLGKYDSRKVEIGACLENDIDNFKLDKIRESAIDTDLVYALFTSGSTGMPKGVVVAHKSIIHYANWVKKTFQLDENTILGNQTPFYFSMSVLDIYTTLCSGATLSIIPKILFTFPADLVDYINEKKINTLYWVPSALGMLTKSNILSSAPLKYVNRILFAGEVMPTKRLNLLKKYMPHALYANLFGPTEITDIGIYYILDRELQDDEPIPIGNTCENVDAFILDEDGIQITEQNKVGELYFRGSYLGLGYYDDWDKTKECYVQNPLNKFYPEIVYRTGDLVKLNEKGEYIYISRKDNQIKHMGHRIELGEIEAAAITNENVENCACTLDESNDELVLFYDGIQVGESTIINYIKSKLPIYMIPNQVKYLDKMPLNQNGKIDRKKLKEKLERN